MKQQLLGLAAASIFFVHCGGSGGSSSGNGGASVTAEDCLPDLTGGGQLTSLEGLTFNLESGGEQITFHFVANELILTNGEPSTFNYASFTTNGNVLTLLDVDEGSTPAAGTPSNYIFTFTTCTEGTFESTNGGPRSGTFTAKATANAAIIAEDCLATLTGVGNLITLDGIRFNMNDGTNQLTFDFVANQIINSSGNPSQFNYQNFTTSGNVLILEDFDEGATPAPGTPANVIFTFNSCQDGTFEFPANGSVGTFTVEESP